LAGPAESWWHPFGGRKKNTCAEERPESGRFLLKYIKNGAGDRSKEVVVPTLKKVATGRKKENRRKLVSRDAGEKKNHFLIQSRVLREGGGQSHRETKEGFIRISSTRGGQERGGGIATEKMVTQSALCTQK